VSLSKRPVIRPRFAPAAVALASLLVACFPGARPPLAPTRASLSLAPGAAAVPAVPAGPLRVVLGAPRGETEQDTEIAFVFNKPMRALGLPATEPPPPVVMRPAAKGAFHWIGSAALLFDAAEQLPPATAYRVEIPAGTRALDGSALAEPFAIAFSTPRPALVSADADGGTTGVTPDASITLGFNQRVTDEEIHRAVTLRSDLRRDPLPFVIHRQDDAHVQITPEAPLPLSDRLHVHADASLRGAGGDLVAGKDRDFVFETVRAPAVRRVACEPLDDDPGACDPGASWITVELTGSVSSYGLSRALHVEPSAGVDMPRYEDDGGTLSDVTIYPDAKPGSTYRVWVDPGRGRLADSFGQELLPWGPAVFRYGHRRASVSFGLAGRYWSAQQKHDFQAYATNAGGAAIGVVPLSLDDVLSGRVGAGASLALPEGLLDETEQAAVHLDTLLPPGTRGPVAITRSYRDRAGAAIDEPAREVQITDLGITARIGHGAAAVLVRGLTEHRPIPGATVEVYRVAGEKRPAVRLGSATTGSEGEATVEITGDFQDGDRLAVVARSGSDWAYRTLDAPRKAPVVGALYTERGVYRPGETVKVAGVFRRAARFGLATPQGGPVAIVVHDAADKPMMTISSTLSAFGTFAADLPVPEDTPVGTYHAVAEVAGGRASHWFRVAEYRPTEIDVAVSLDRPAYVRGDELHCAVRGRYLHGGAMNGGAATVVVSREAGWYEIPGLQGYVIEEDGRPRPPSSVARYEGKLDAGGALSFTTKLAMPAQLGPERVFCAVEAADLNRQALGAQADAPVHPGEVYAALARPDDYDVPEGKSFDARLLAVTPSGERRSMRARVEAILRAGRSQEETPAGACDVTTGADPVKCHFAVPAAAPAGATILVRASIVDGRGNTVRASYAMRVVPPPKPQPIRPPSPPPPPMPPRLEVSTARELKLGETGHLAIASPFKTPSIALVTIEREGIVWQRVVEVPGAQADVAFPVTDAMMPDATAAVMLVSGSAAQRAATTFEVDTSSRLLAVAIETGGDAHAPGEEVDVDVAVKDAAGKPTPAEVTLWAADEASLSLTYYQVPRPGYGLFGWRQDLVVETEARDDLVRVGRLGGSHRTRAPTVRMGATQVSPPRGDFRQTVFFAPHLVTDAAGRLHRRVKLPDGITAYRFLAVAVAADDRTGSAEKTITSSLPIMARASLPRALRAGDRFEASVVVSTKDLPTGDAEVLASASGLTLDGPASRTVRLDPGAPVEVRFPLRADRAGPAEFTVRASLGHASDAMTLKAEVVTPLLPESVAIDGETRDAVAERLGDLGAIRPDYGGLTLTLSSSPLAGLADGIEQLVEYPHGCTEQTVSRMVPLLALSDLAKAVEASLPADTAAALRDAVTRVLGNQRGDGGFGLWPESRASQPWVTAYALWGLGEVGRRGAAVPAGALSRARAYLAGKIAPGADAPEDLALAAFVADVEAEDGHPDAALLDRLGKARAALPPSGRALLLHALALGHGDPAIRSDLARSLEAVLRIDGAAARAATPEGENYDALLDSDTRTTALILRAFVAEAPDHPLVSRLGVGLLEARRGGRWRTTHEAAWALLALDALRRAHPPASAGLDARAFLGETLLAETPLSGAKAMSFEVPAAQLLGGQPLTFAASGGGTLHYHARLRFARREAPAEPVEAGFFLGRVERSPGRGAGKPGTFTVGDLVQVELTVATPSPRRFVALTSPLPGGFEPADTDLRLGGSWLRDLESRPIGRRELRDDRVVYFVDDLPSGVTTFRYVARATSIGTFSEPPAQVEEMYTPETFARTAAETITIVPR
jgi:alpha-2-macroglobulin